MLWLKAKSYKHVIFVSKIIQFGAFFDFLMSAREQKNDLSLIQWHNFCLTFKCFTFFVHVHWAYGFCCIKSIDISASHNTRFLLDFTLPFTTAVHITKCQFLRRFRKCFFPLFFFFSWSIQCIAKKKNWKFLRGFDCLHMLTPNRLLRLFLHNKESIKRYFKHFKFD